MITVVGRLLEASNATFLVEVDGTQHVYKPTAGEKPLWDFADGTLGRREVAAGALSEAGGFHVVPPTRWIDEGPMGPGMLQRWVDHTDRAVVDVVPTASLPREGWFEIFEGRDEHERAVSVIHADDLQLRTMALFDVVTNNSDRKGGHILCTDDAVLGVDHGVTFHTDPKLRTLLWGWAGAALTDDELTLLATTRERLDVLDDYLTGDEIAATADRIDRLIVTGVFPLPTGQWPALPWPVW